MTFRFDISNVASSYLTRQRLNSECFGRKNVVIVQAEALHGTKGKKCSNGRFRAFAGVKLKLG